VNGRITYGALLVTALAALATACGTLPRTDTAGVMHEAIRPDRGFAIDAIAVDYAGDFDPPAYPLREVLEVIAGTHEVLLATTDASTGPYLLDIWVREEAFTAILTVHDSKDRREIARFVYREDGSRTIESFYHLYDVMDRLVEELADSLEEPGSEGADEPGASQA